MAEQRQWSLRWLTLAAGGLAVAVLLIAYMLSGGSAQADGNVADSDLVDRDVEETVEAPAEPAVSNDDALEAVLVAFREADIVVNRIEIARDYESVEFGLPMNLNDEEYAVALDIVEQHGAGLAITLVREQLEIAVLY